jgi:hypothetical protein
VPLLDCWERKTLPTIRSRIPTRMCPEEVYSKTRARLADGPRKRPQSMSNVRGEQELGIEPFALSAGSHGAMRVTSTKCFIRFLGLVSFTGGYLLGAGAAGASEGEMALTSLPVAPL